MNTYRGIGWLNRSRWVERRGRSGDTTDKKGQVVTDMTTELAHGKITLVTEWKPQDVTAWLILNSWPALLNWKNPPAHLITGKQ